MLKDEFVMVGIGQGGCKLAKNFYDEKYRSFFINTSYDDLSQLKVKEEFMYHIPGARGCAKQRPIAIQYAKDYYKPMIGKLLSAHPTAKVYIIHYTLGGGTGGALSNIFCALFKKELNEVGKKDAMIIAVTAKPKKYESWKLQNNAEKSLDELYKMVEMGVVNQYYILNNDSRKSLSDVNDEHRLLFDRWIEGEKANNISNVDESERMDLFKLKGNAMLFEFDANVDDEFSEKIEKAYKNSIYCKPMKKPTAVGIALNSQLDEQKSIEKIEATIGYFKTSHTTPTNVTNMIMIAGVKENKAIKNGIIKIANEKAKKINEDIEDEDEEDVKAEKIERDISESESDNTVNNKKEEDGFASIDDILNMFS